MTGERGRHSERGREREERGTGERTRSARGHTSKMPELAQEPSLGEGRGSLVPGGRGLGWGGVGSAGRRHIVLGSLEISHVLGAKNIETNPTK